MKSQSKVVLVQRAAYKEALIYYSKNGAKSRVSTKVRIPDNVDDFETALNKNQKKIQKVHARVEALIDSYHETVSRTTSCVVAKS